MNGERKNTSPWVYVGIGCTVIVVLAVILISTCAYVGYQWSRKVERQLSDPQQREAAVLELLGVEQLPEGYFAGMSIAVPFVMEMAVLTDRQSGPKDKTPEAMFDQRGFMYIHVRLKKVTDPAISDYFSGKSNDPSVLRKAGVNVDIDAGDVIRRGVIDGSPSYMYVAQRGGMPHAGAGPQPLNTIVLIRCPGTSDLRLGIWGGPDPTAGGSLEGADWTGTVADERAIAEFLGQFKLCR